METFGGGHKKRVIKFAQLLFSALLRQKHLPQGVAVHSHVGTAEAECDSVRTTSTDRTLGALEIQCIWKIISLIKSPTLLFKI